MGIWSPNGLHEVELIADPYLLVKSMRKLGSTTQPVS
jgi:hypothetical protein